MKHTFKTILLIAGLAAMVWSCHEPLITPQPIVALYQELPIFDKMKPSRRDSLLKADSLEISAMMQVYGLSEVTPKLISNWNKSAAVKMFTPATDSVFPSVKPIEETLGSILANAKIQKLDIPTRRYAAVVWNNLKSIVLTDSVVLIALNHYLGADHPAYKGWPTYLAVNKTPAMLPYDLAESLVASALPFEESDSSTVLSRMVYEGALAMAKIRLVPEGTLAQALGYTEKQLQWLGDHSQQMWDTLVGRELLFSTSTDVAERLVGPSPATSVFGPDCPGRAGRYIGYCILVSYLQSQPGMSLVEMLNPSFYNNPALLVESAYAG